MIIWRNEEIIGAPVYNFLEGQGADIAGVGLRLVNGVRSAGTVFSAANMGRMLQRAESCVRHFYYDGSDVALAGFAAASDGTNQGILLGRCDAHDCITAAGIVYLADDAGTTRISRPTEHEVRRGGLLFCRPGRVVRGVIFNRKGMGTWLLRG